MYKIFVYKNGNFELRFTSSESLDNVQSYIKGWFDYVPEDKSKEFIICDKDKIIKTLNISHFE